MYPLSDLNPLEHATWSLPPTLDATESLPPAAGAVSSPARFCFRMTHDKEAHALLRTMSLLCILGKRTELLIYSVLLHIN